MYSGEDFERLFIRYKGKVYPKGKSIQRFCHKNNVFYNLFEKCYKDTWRQVMDKDIFGRTFLVEANKLKEEETKQKREFSSGVPQDILYRDNRR